MELQSEDVLDHLTSLVDQSLVLLEGGEAGPVRCRLLESVRAYARARLADSGEAETYRQQHAVYYLGLAEEALPAPGRTLQPAVLDRLAQAHDNLRAALRWCIAQDDAGRGLRL
ncbi:MAG: AfsR/SARP family transcriptional regulator, partial [Chloroflexota bacterium]